MGTYSLHLVYNVLCRGFRVGTYSLGVYILYSCSRLHRGLSFLLISQFLCCAQGMRHGLNLGIGIIMWFLVSISHQYQASIVAISAILNFGSDISQYYKINIVLGTSKSDTVLPIYNDI